MKKYYFVLWGIAIYFGMCLIEIFLWEIPVIPHYGFESYSGIEKVLLSSIIILFAFLVVFLLRCNSIIDFVINAMILWLTFWGAGGIFNIRLWTGILTGHEADVLGVNFLSQDIWIIYYIGCLIGTIAGGVVSLYRQHIRTCN